MASQVDSLYYFIFWGSAFFFLLIVGLSTIFVIRYRRRAENELKPRAHHNTPLEVAWTLIPLILVMVVFVWGFKGFMALHVPPAHSLDYYVTGKKWLWEVAHPNGEVAINEMTVPLGKPVKVILKSDDVLHSFFIPAFRVKQDVLPNRYTVLWFEATIPGDYDLFCTEYCGAGHSGMLAKVHVLAGPEWDEWERSTGGRPGDMPLADWGAKLYQSKACVTCHSLDGSVKTGPSFQRIFGHEAELADGSRVVVDEEYLRRSILEPQVEIVAGFQPVMPTYAGTLTPEDIDALVAFIKAQE